MLYGGVAGRSAIVEWCMAHGVDIDQQGEQGHTALHLATMHGSTASSNASHSELVAVGMQT